MKAYLQDVRYLNKQDLRELGTRINQKNKPENSDMRLFIASKHGNNSVGRGANRTVILGTFNGTDWMQIYKFWGRNHEQRAKEFMDKFNDQNHD